MTLKVDTIECADALAYTRQLPDESVHCCVTSPPYWGLRDYGVAGQLGLEQTPEEYAEKMVEIFREVRRVLRKDGTLWLVIGDSYCASQTGSVTTTSTLEGGKKTQHAASKRPDKNAPGLKPKDLVGIPWMVAFALRADGWWLRQDIIWHKPNPMPESVKDRCTKAHEYIFMLSKSARYYYDADAIKEPAKDPKDDLRRIYDRQHSGNKSVPTEKRAGLRPRRDKQRGHGRRYAGFNARWDAMTKEEQCSGRANKRDVWRVTTKPFKEAHFATYPPDLIEPCILAGCPEGGIVLDPFMGAGTTALVANRLGRHYVGCELNPEDVEMARKRVRADAPLFAREGDMEEKTW